MASRHRDVAGRVTCVFLKYRREIFFIFITRLAERRIVRVHAVAASFASAAARSNLDLSEASRLFHAAPSSFACSVTFRPSGNDARASAQYRRYADGARFFFGFPETPAADASAAFAAAAAASNLDRSTSLSAFHDAPSRFACSGTFSPSGNDARASAQWRAGDLAGAVAGLGAFAAAAAADNRRRRNAGLPSVPPPAKIVSLGARLDRLRELRDRGVDALDDGRPDVAARAFGEALATPLARPLWFRRRPDDAERRNANRKRTPYPNAARGELLRRRAEALLEALDQRVDVDVDGCDPGSETETADAPSDADASEEGDFAARDDGGDGGDGASTTRARGALHLAARDLRESLLIDPGDVEARRARVRLRRSIGDTLGAFDDARAALDAAPGDEALNRAARELAAEATRRGDGDSSSSDGFRDGAKSAVPRGPVPAAYRALGVSRDADARSIRRAYRRAAAKWHPDKWTMRSEAERETAAAAFRRVAGAYEALGDAKRRRAYDADPERFPID